MRLSVRHLATKHPKFLKALTTEVKMLMISVSGILRVAPEKSDDAIEPSAGVVEPVDEGLAKKSKPKQRHRL